MADDLDSRQLSCYGGKNLKTKNTDALAAEGMKFDQMICSEAMCVPTRASLFTGLKYMMNPENKASYWNDWIAKAQSSPEIKNKLTE